MFIRSKKNKSVSVSIQIIDKRKGIYRVVETIGSGWNDEERKYLEQRARNRLQELSCQRSLAFKSSSDTAITSFLESVLPPIVKNVGPELVLGKIFDSIGFNTIEEKMFRHITLARLFYPVSKLKTVEYLNLHHGIDVEITAIYRFLDRFYKGYKDKVEQIVYEHSRKTIGKITVVFYDMTTLYFEAEDEDDLRKIGFSKDGKFRNPQIMLGLLVGENGYPIGYDIFEGNKFEGHTLIPVIEDIQKKYNLPKPIVVADSGLLSKENISSLKAAGYKFIIGARIKNEDKKSQQEILKIAKTLKDGDAVKINRVDGHKLIINYSNQRAKKDMYNRDKGISNLRKSIAGGKLTKQRINNRGYNKFLTIKNKVEVSLDEDKIKAEAVWDGLKGYITNTKLSANKVIDQYKELWKIEKAFRISKTDLRIRPIFHRKRERIEAHLCIAFAAYAIYKELEKRLQVSKIDVSPAKAIEHAKAIYQISFKLPDSAEVVTIFNGLSDLQHKLLKI